MNEHEQHSSAGDEPQHPEPESPRGPEPATPTGIAPSSELSTVSLDDGPTYAETNVSVIREGIRRYGQPFLAYLILDGVEQRSPDLVEQYEARYLGSFEDRRSFAHWAITDLGWADDLVELQLEGIWPDDVEWNTDALWPALTERYALTERLGGVHAFRR